MKIVIRTLGGKRSGYGHFYRCLSLAKAFKYYANEKESVEVIFMVNEELKTFVGEEGFNCVVSNDLEEDDKLFCHMRSNLILFDSYLGDDAYLKRLKKRSPVVLLDDHNELYDTRLCDVVINGNAYAKELGYPIHSNTTFLLGMKYLILKEEYWGEGVEDVAKGKINKSSMSHDTPHILITTGGSDQGGVSYELLQVLKDVEMKKRVIIGPGYSGELITKLREVNCNKELIIKPHSLKEYIESASIILSACGTTVYEILSTGKKPIIFSVADNQDKGCDYFKKKGLVYGGKYPSIQYGFIKETVIDLMNGTDNQEVNKLRAVNGDGARAIVMELLKRYA